METFDYKARATMAFQVANFGKDRPEQEPRHIDIHITGTALHARAQKQRISPLKRLYRVFSGSSVFSTFGIDPWGEIWQFCSCRRRQGAQGWGYTPRQGGKVVGLGGISKVRRHLDEIVIEGKADLKYEVPRWWTDHNVHLFLPKRPRILERTTTHVMWKKMPREKLEYLYTPLDFLDADERSPNDNSISVECIQWQRSYKAWDSLTYVNKKLTTAQYVALHNLVFDRCSAWGIDPYNRRQIRGHEQTNPWTRGTRKGGWDPGAQRDEPNFCWDCMRTLDFTHGGKYDLCPSVIKMPRKKPWE